MLALARAAGRDDGRRSTGPPSVASPLDAAGVIVVPADDPQPVDRATAEAQETAIEAGGPAAAGLSSETALRIDETVVTARRREELRQETPLSVTALDEAELRAAQVETTLDLQRLIPNLTFIRSGTGQDIAPFIRGVGALPFSYLDQGVGTYVDGVYLSRGSGGLLQVVDFQQIEVLRGPQGTLYGKNTVGGAINVATIKPRRETEASVDVRAGSYGEADTKTMLNVPVGTGWLADHLHSRLTFASFNRAGYTTNTLTDESYSDTNALVFYGALRFAPRDDLTFDLTGTWSRDHNKGLGGQCRFVPQSAELNPSTGRTNNPFNAFLPPGYREACDRSQKYRFASEVASPIADVESSGVWGILDWRLGEVGPVDLDLRYTGSWREQIVRGRNDIDMTQFPVLVLAYAGGPPAGSNPRNINGTPTLQDQVQQELQLTGRAWDGRLSFVSGVFLYWESIDEDNALRFLPGNPLLDANGGVSNAINRIDNRDWAFYGQATADVTDWLSLTAGLRYTEERKALEHELTIPEALNPPDPVPSEFSNSRTSGAWTPMASVAFKTPREWLRATGILDWAMPYFTYARGFIGGGVNGAGRTDSPLESETFGPEFANSYEWGVKTIAFGGRASLDFDWFLLDRTDQQVAQLVQDDSACPPGSDPACVTPTLALVTNAGRSKTYGLETEFRVTPVPGLWLSGGAGYTHARFLDFPNAESSITGDTINRAGEPLPFVPEWTTHAALEYAYELPRLRGPSWVDGWLTPRVDVAYTSGNFFYAPEIEELQQSGYVVVNFRLAWDFNDDRSRIAFWAKNLTDTAYYDAAVASPRLAGSVTRYYDAPRTFGVEIAQRF
jgi:iron complex outermembrane receptor protein